MKHEDATFFISFFSATILVNLCAIIVLFFYQRRKHRNVKITLFSLLIIHVLFSINQLTRAFVSRTNDSAISNHLTGFTCLMSCIQITIMTVQCLLNAVALLRDKFGKQMYNFTVVSVFVSWLACIVILLPLICIEASQSHTSEQLDRYFQGIMVSLLADILLFLSLQVYVAYRTWINVDITNIINFSTNRRNVTMTILSGVFVVVSILPFITSSLKMSVNKMLVDWLLWLDKLLIPLLFVLIYAAKHFLGVLKRTLINRHETFRHINSAREEQGVTVINSFTHVQPVTNLMSTDSSSQDVLECSVQDVTACTDDSMEATQDVGENAQNGFEVNQYAVEPLQYDVENSKYNVETLQYGNEAEQYDMEASQYDAGTSHRKTTEYGIENFKYDFETSESDVETSHYDVAGAVVLSFEDVSVSYV